MNKRITNTVFFSILGAAVLTAAVAAPAISQSPAKPLSVGEQAELLTEGGEAVYLTSDDTEPAYEAFTASFDLELGGGYTWPAEVPASLDRSDLIYEEGVVEMQSILFWSCSWRAEILQNQGDPAAVAAAVAEANKLAELELVQTDYVGYQDYLDTAVAPALEGDFTVLTELGADCKL